MISRETLPAESRILNFRENSYGTEKPDRSFLESGVAAGAVPSFFCPMASCLADQVSARQIHIVRGLAREISLDENELSWELFDCDFTELSRQAAERLIEYLSDTGAAIRHKLNMRLAG